MNTSDEKRLRFWSSTGILKFGTTAPFRIEPELQVRKIGFADIPAILQHLYTKPEGLAGLVPVLRDRVFAWLKQHRISDEAVGFHPTISLLQRNRLFVDENPDSRSCGKRKRGVYCRCWFEIRPGWTGRFRWDLRKGEPIPVEELL